MTETIKPPHTRVESLRESESSERDSTLLATADDAVISEWPSSPNDSDIGSETEATFPSVLETVTPLSRFQVPEISRREADILPIRTDVADFHSCFQSKLKQFTLIFTFGFM